MPRRGSSFFFVKVLRALRTGRRAFSGGSSVTEALAREGGHQHTDAYGQLIWQRKGRVSVLPARGSISDRGIPVSPAYIGESSNFTGKIDKMTITLK